MKISCIASSIFPPGTTMMFGRDMNESCSIDSRYGKSMPLGLANRMTTKALVGGRDEAGDERIRRVHRRDALEVHVRPGELRADVMHVVRHAPQDRVHDGLAGVAAGGLVAVQLLDPLEVDDRDHPDQQVCVLRDVDLAGDRGTVQPLVEEHVAAGVDVLPRREGAGLLPVGLGLLGVVQVLADLAATVSRRIRGTGPRVPRAGSPRVRNGRSGGCPAWSASAVATFICSRS